MKSTFIKSIVLISSVSLVILFIVYKTGFFHEKQVKFQKTLLINSNDNIVMNTDSKKVKLPYEPSIISSSKSIILLESDSSLLDSLLLDSTILKLFRNQVSQ